MLRSFAEIETKILDAGAGKTIALAGSHDLDALSAVVNAKRRGVVKAILIGREEETRSLLKQLGESPDDYTLIPEEDETAMAAKACGLVAEGKADLPMKGLMQTSTFMRAILDKTRGFVPEKGLVSQATLFEYPDEGRMMLMTDCAINIAPDYPTKVRILENAVALARSLDADAPKVAVLAAVEVVNPAMSATIEAAMLSKAAQRGQIKNCIVDGPLAFDNAVSRTAAQHKGIVSEVAGQADILLVPDLEAGNMLTKSLTYFAKFKTAGCVCGTNVPVVMTSRTDSPEDKYHSILAAVYQTL